MTKENTKGKKGFTIIEVVLVLAIAGLIFLMVFVALPALQRSQRDTQRRDDISRMATAITQYQTNNGGKIPDTNALGTNGATFITNYLGGATSFTDPDGNAYTITLGTKAKTLSVTAVDHKIYYQTSARCNGESAEGTNNSRDYALLYKLEGSGVVCVDNS